MAGVRTTSIDVMNGPQNDPRSPQSRDPGTGRYGYRDPLPEPPARLLDALRTIARASARKVFNDPRLDRHVSRMVLAWLMDWDPSNIKHVRQYIGLRAANEARRVRIMPNDGQRRACERSLDALRLTKRDSRGAYDTYRSERTSLPDP